MKKRLVWKLLASLDAPEREYFLKWLKVELNQTQQYVQELATILVSIYPHPQSSYEIWPSLYPEQPYDDGRFRKLASDLSSRLEEFVSWLAFKEDSVQSKVQVLRFYEQRNQLALFEKHYRKLKRELEKSPVKNATYFRTLYEVETEYQRLKVKESQKVRPELLASISLSLDSWWLQEKLPISLRVKIREMQGYQPQHYFLLQNILEEIRSHPAFYEQSLIKIYVDAHNMLANAEVPDTSSLLAFLTEEKGHLTDIEFINIFYLIQNYLVRRINISIEQEYIEQLQSLFEWGIKHKIIFQDDHLPWRSLYNIIAVLLNLSLVEIANTYLHTYIHYVSEQDREETQRFLDGFISFFAGEYRKALDIFSVQKFQIDLFEVSARSFLLQINYELGIAEPSWLISQAETFSKYIRNKKIQAKIIEFHLAFSKQYIKLNRLFDKQDLEHLLKDVSQTSNTHKKRWLTEKIKKKMG
ncbi:MAG: hypothetical protein AAF824_06945 [Bacteroidota bacterium]